MKKKHKRYTESEKAAVLKAARVSSNIAATLKDKGVSSSLFYKWKNEAKYAEPKQHGKPAPTKQESENRPIHDFISSQNLNFNLGCAVMCICGSDDKHDKLISAGRYLDKELERIGLKK